MTLMFIELHSRSAFSFLEAASLPEALAGWCAELSMPAMALLDRDGVYGAPRFHLAAQKARIKAHIGSEVTVRNSPQTHRDTEKISNSEFRISNEWATACSSLAEIENRNSKFRPRREAPADFEPRCAPGELGPTRRAL